MLQHDERQPERKPGHCGVLPCQSQTRSGLWVRVKIKFLFLMLFFLVLLLSLTVYLSNYIHYIIHNCLLVKEKHNRAMCLCGYTLDNNIANIQLIHICIWKKIYIY